jgi:hypothetical protein
VSGSLAPGPSATPADLRAAQNRELLLRTELPRVRQAAAAWRNGLGGLLAALVGFSLIKGRSDITRLAPDWAVAVGLLLLAALLAGTTGALLLIRAANGRPSVASVRDLLPRAAAEHIEALASATSLRRGIGLTFGCTALLVAAVATTWYGPAKDEPMLRVSTPDGTVCGVILRVDHGGVVLDTAAGEVRVILSIASTVEPVATCQAP